MISMEHLDSVTHHDNRPNNQVTNLLAPFVFGVQLKGPVGNAVGKEQEQGYGRRIGSKAGMYIALY